MATALIAGNRRQPQALGQAHRRVEIGTRLQLRLQIALAQQVQDEVDRFARYVFARHPFTKAFGIVLQDAPHHHVVRLAAAMRGVANRSAERNSDVIGGQLDNLHALPIARVQGRECTGTGGPALAWTLS